MKSAPIKGYRDLSATEVEMINEIKDLAEHVGERVEQIYNLDHVDKRWVSIGKTDLQKGFMSLIRGIAQPETF